jgi:hypothetical protein
MSVTVANAPGATIGAFTVSVGGGVMVNGSGSDVPPPGADVVARTSAVPTVVISAPGIDARSSPLLTTVVGRATPLNSTTVRGTNPAPRTVSVIPPNPARALAGDSDVMVGGSAVVGNKALSASYARTRGTVQPSTPERMSVTGSPVCRSTFRIVPTLNAGVACFNRPHTPATCGAAIDVPRNV